MATPEEIRSTVRSYTERFTASDKEGWVALFAADASIEDPVGAELRHGPDGAATFWDFSHSLASDIELKLTGPTRVAGHEAAFPMQIITAIGDDKFALDVIDVMTFTPDARIRTMRAFWDMADLHPYEG